MFKSQSIKIVKTIIKSLFSVINYFSIRILPCNYKFETNDNLSKFVEYT